MTQFLRDEGSDSEEVITPLMLDGTYLSRNFATLGPFLTLQPPCDSIRSSLHCVPIEWNEERQVREAIACFLHIQFYTMKRRTNDSRRNRTQISHILITGVCPSCSFGLVQLQWNGNEAWIELRQREQEEPHEPTWHFLCLAASSPSLVPVVFVLFTLITRNAWIKCEKEQNTTATGTQVNH